MRVNKKELVEELTDAFIAYQNNMDTPFPHPQKSREELIEHYLSDQLFHRKVQSLVCGVMSIIDKHI